MVLNIRNIILASVPALAGLLGIFWFTRRKKDPPIQYRKPKDKRHEEGTVKKQDIGNGEPSLGKHFEVEETPIIGIKATTVTSSAPNVDVGVKEDTSTTLTSTLSKVETEIVEPVIENSSTKQLNCSQHQVKDDLVLHGVEAAQSTLNAIDVKDLCSPTLDSETSESSESSQDSVVLNKLSPPQDLSNGETAEAVVEVAINNTSQQQHISEVAPPNEKTCVDSSPIEIVEEVVKPQEWAEDEGLNCESISDNELVVETEEAQHTSESQISSPSCGNCSPIENGNASSNSDTPSETSQDSGRGATITDNMPHKGPQETITFEFDFPSDLCGLFIGKRGKNIAELKEITGAEISVKRKLYTTEVQLVCVEGTQRQIDKTVRLIKQKFPTQSYNVNYAQSAPETPMLTPEMMQLSLPEGVSVDVIVSSVVAPNHVFVQQPTHPTFHMLERLNVIMNLCYTQEPVPLLPRPIDPGIICAAPMLNGWYRAQVVQSHTEEDESEIKFVDYGGYMRVTNANLRQIRSDFATLPFQAVECYMANVIPPKDQEAFPAEANAVMEEMVQSKMLQIQVHGHEEEDGVPYVQLFQVNGEQAVVVNRELVNRGVAQWLEH